MTRSVADARRRGRGGSSSSRRGSWQGSSKGSSRRGRSSTPASVSSASTARSQTQRSMGSRRSRARQGTASLSRSSPNFQTTLHTFTTSGPPQSETTPTQEIDTEIVQEVIMALDMRENNTMGCAFFSTCDGVLQVSEDIPMAELDMAEQFLIHVQPTTCLVSGRAPEILRAFLEKASNNEIEGEEAAPRFVIRAMPSSEFCTQSAREMLVNLPDSCFSSAQAFVSSDDDDPTVQGLINAVGPPLPQQSDNMKLLLLASRINMDCTVSLSCVGAVLSDLQRRRSTGFLPDGQVTEDFFRVEDLRPFTLSDYMFVSAETLLSLQIVQSELHPNTHVWGVGSHGGSVKESLSVYGLFHQLACTPQGKIQLQRLFLRPTLDLCKIHERQKTVTLLAHPENAETVKHITSVMRKIRNVRPTVVQLRKGTDCSGPRRSPETGVWATLLRFAAQCLRLREQLGSLKTDVRVVSKLIDGIQPGQLMAIGDMISRTIDFEQSKDRRRTSVKTGVDPRLDELKRRYDGMGSFLTEVVNQMNQRLPEWASQYIKSCIFLPQLGFLTVVDYDPQTGHGKYQGEGTEGERWEKLFTADGAVCYKNQYMKELDEHYGDMYCEIGDREVEIIHDLSTRVLVHEKTLITVSDICGEFDALLSLAVGAVKYGWHAPQMSTDNIVKIQGGRHPLQELVVPSFVPNDCDLSGGGGSSGETGRSEGTALVVTGPNHSGKSIYMKQIAIIIYLAHIGSFVPAENAVIGLTDQILTRMSTRESLAQTESAFAIDLRQIVKAMRFSTRSSLVLVDEFGKGTNADDGIGLLAAMLDHFHSLGPDMPRLLLATHFHELIEGKYIDCYDNLSFGHMDVRTDWKAVRTEDQVTYLFKFMNGYSLSSFGARCASLNGVPSAIVERADALGVLISRNEDLAAACAKLSPEEERELEVAEAVARHFLERDFYDAEQGGMEDEQEQGQAVKALLEGCFRLI